MDSAPRTDGAGHGDEWRPCSREQEGLWLLEQTRAVAAANNLPFGLAIEGELDIERLESALRRTVARQPALRTDLAVVDGRLAWRERSRSAAPVELEIVAVGDAEEESTALAERSRRPLDPLRWPQFRAALVSRSRTRHTLLLVLHHAVVDGGSMDPLLREIAAAYGAPASSAPADARSTADRFLAEEREAIPALAAEASAYWTKELAAIDDSLRLPMGPRASGWAESVDLNITAALRSRLNEVAERHRTSLFVALLAALQVLQHRYAGDGDDGVATAVAMDARPRAMRGTIGMFSNEAPLHSTPRRDEPFAEFLGRVRDGARRLFALRRFPFTEALARFGWGADRREAGAQLGVTYLRYGRPAIAMPGVEVRPLGVLPAYSSRRPLMLWLFDEPERLPGRLDFDPVLVDPEIAIGFARHYVRVLEAVARDPAVALDRLELLEPAEQARLLARWSGEQVARREARSVPAMVEEQVRRSPSARAVESATRTLSYAELNAAANQLARRLSDAGAAPRAPIALCLERSPELVIAMLAVMKAGAPYLPLDPGYPESRLRLMLDRSRAPLVVTAGEARDRFSGTRAGVIALDRIPAGPSGRPSADPAPGPGPDDLAYVIFTSGSTGTPKGVAMPHRGLVNLLAWQRRTFERAGSARCLQFASPSFDVAFQEIFSTLATGGTVVLVDDETRRDFQRLAAHIAGAGVDRLFLPPLVLNEVARHLASAAGGAHHVEVITAGERLEITPAIRELFRRRTGWTLKNQYGPTETHVVTEHRLEGSADRWPVLPPIGRPINGVHVYVLDRHLRPVPSGVPGELHLGGHCLADGYLGQPKLTAERFLASPFGPPGTRMYRTGDLVRWSGDGALEFLGRVDEQVKIRGYRVEPGEVEAAILALPSVRDVAVVPRDDAPGGRRLVGYVVPGDGASPSPRTLRAHLERLLPDYMVPSAFALVQVLPRTANGKLDRRALPEPEWCAGDAYVAPRCAAEEALARIWADVLGLDRVGIEDDFFRLGGHSLLAGEMIARARSSLGREFTLRALFAGPTVAQLAASVDEAGRAAGADAPIPRAPRRTLAELRAEDRRG